MKKVITAIVVTLVLVSVSFAGEGTAEKADKAVALVERAVNYVKAKGKDAAFKEFSNPQGKFIDGDLYIFAIDYDGNVLAHGGSAKWVGKNMIKLRDADHVFYIGGMIDLARTKGRGWFDYKFLNPETKKIEPKSTYIQKMDNYLLGCGIYNKKEQSPF